MNVLHLSTSDIDSGGARAAYRLHRGLRSVGCNSQMMVRAKFSSDDSVIAEGSILTKLGPPVSRLPLKMYPKHSGSMFSPQWFPDVLADRASQISPDIVHLHWVCNGYLKIETLRRFKRPLVWTLHDMWTFTGGCDYSGDCEGYRKSCGACPQLQSDRSFDLSRWVWKRKAKAWKGLDLTLVATTSWMASCARASSLFKNSRIEIIPLGLDTEQYKPHNQHFARQVLGLPENKQLVLFGAINGTSDRRKGFQFLTSALKYLKQSERGDQVELVVFGTSKPEREIDLGFKTHYVGRLKDDISLALVYSACDVSVVPSIQEAFGQTASESLACSVPVVAFNATGLRDIVDHEQTGYLASPFESEDIARGIAWILEDQERHQKLKHQAREKSLKEYASTVQAERYLSLYEEVLGDYQ